MGMSWLKLGPVTIRVGSKYLAKWGFPRVQIGGLSFWSRDTGGRLHLAAYHPRGCLTWHWFVALYRSGHGHSGWFDLQWRKGFGERGLTLFGWTLSITEQGYHKERVPA
jgi:hypothetical protein